MERFRLTKNDCEDIGFAQSCLTSGIISFDEFKEWLFLIVEAKHDVPNYIFEIIDLKEKFDFVPLRIMKFNPYWEHTGDEDDALDGIGYKRRLDFHSDAVSRSDALQKLIDNPHIEERFRNTFPFIDL